MITRKQFWSLVRAVLVVASLLTVCALAVLVQMPGYVFVGLGVLGLSLGATTMLAEYSYYRTLSFWLGGGGSLQVCCQLLCGSQVWDYLYGAMAFLVGAALWLSDGVVELPRSFRSWRVVALVWMLVGLLVMVATAYVRDELLAFYAGAVGIAGVAFLGKRWLPLPGWATQMANTIILLSVGLCVADFLLFPREHLKPVPKVRERAYSYEYFKHDPGGFARWLEYFAAEGNRMCRAMFTTTPDGVVQYVLKSNLTVRYGENEIRLNNFGFRGRDIQADKGKTFRIVALGESTTFGINFDAGSRPWCEILEDLIRERLKPERPVEVINAGIPSVTLSYNLTRLSDQILPLKPDLIISYHGYNQFTSLDAQIPQIFTRIPPPRYRSRPLELLAKAEYQFRMRRYAREISRPVGGASTPTDPMKSAYADDYRTLIHICQERGIHLALATYSMAVNEQSDAGLKEFYHQVVHALPARIRACELHTRIIEQLAKNNPEVWLVDTRPSMDGEHIFYTDLVHFTSEGEQRMAEVMFAGIKEQLKKELARP